MKITGLVALFFMGMCLPVNAQKNDYNWLSGYESNSGYDTVGQGWGFGNTLMNFNYSPVNISYDSLIINFCRTNTSYSDDNGNLLFSTNGIFVLNDSNQIIQGSNGLNAGWLDEVWDPTIQQGGYRNQQGIIALQDLTNPDYIHLLYSFTDSLPGSQGTNVYYAKVLGALLDVSANEGNGVAININQVIISDSIGAEVTAVRHGNGRDWWILIQKRNSNCFYRVLLNPGGAEVMPDLTCLGVSVANDDVGAACFSPDGSKFVYLAANKGLSIYDFDRCGGTLSNSQYLPLPVLVDSNWGGHGVAISPNNRFLYVSATEQLYQFDLWSSDVFGSIDTIGIYDGFAFPFGSYFFDEQLGPDGKIYISCGNSEADYHVINNPDAKGDSCNFVQHGVLLPTISLCVPNFPNYRLGALTQSQCDSLTGLNEAARAAKEQIIKIYPNPAGAYATVDYGFTDWNKGQPTLQICDALGQTVYTQTLPMYSGFQKLDISNFAAGIYTVFIKRENGVVATCKLVKE